MTNKKELGELGDELIAVSPPPNPPQPPVTPPPAAIQQNDAYAQFIDDVNTPPARKEVRAKRMLEAARAKESDEKKD